MTDPADPKDDSEPDVADDDHVAASRAGGSGDQDDEDSGSYVGRTGSDDALDTEESGAEARARNK